jgi:UDPglucose 6-dehydrogenase
MGHEVVLVDNNPKKVESLQAGSIPIYEPGLEAMVHRNSKEGRLSFTTSTRSGVATAEVIFLAVGTPPQEDGSANLQFMYDAVKEVAASLRGYAVIVVKSTVPVGTGDEIAGIFNKCADYEVDVVSNPEFLKEGDAISDFMKPDRVVIGTDSPSAISVMKTLYAPFTKNSERLLVMDRRSAELTKYAANAMLATRISFMNEMSRLCDALGADVEWVRKGIGSDPRIGTDFLYPGLGFGGSCFPKDLSALISMGAGVGERMELLESVVEVNTTQRDRLVDRIISHFGGELRGKKIAVWGAAFKPNTDDTRESPALALIYDLKDLGAEVVVSDPVAEPEGLEIVKNHYDSVNDADALVLATEWREYRRPDFLRIKRRMRGNVIFDGRNIFDIEDVKKAGFTYYGIGHR